MNRLQASSNPSCALCVHVGHGECWEVLVEHLLPELFFLETGIYYLSYCLTQEIPTLRTAQ